MKLWLALLLGLTARLVAAEPAWKWSGQVGEGSVTLLILGDIQVHQRRADPKTAFAHLRSTLRMADLIYANLEGVLVKSAGAQGDIPDKKGWTHPGANGLVALQDAHIEAVGLANNVAYGRQNILRTLALLDARGIAHAGAGKNFQAAHRPAIVQRGGVKFGFLQYTARWYRAEQQLATATLPGVAAITSRDGLTLERADQAQLRQDIGKLRSQVDIVIVSEHNRDGATKVQFGPEAHREHQRDPSHPEAYQRQFARLALDAGADLVFGHGTHCLQGVELYRGKPIFYGIGHSAFDQPGHENFKDGLVVRVVVEHKRVRRVSFVPVTRNEHNDPLMLDPSRGAGAEMVRHLQQLSPQLSLRRDGQEVVVSEARPPARPK